MFNSDTPQNMQLVLKNKNERKDFNCKKRR